MLKNSQIRNNIEAGAYDQAFGNFFKSSVLEDQKSRYIRVSREFDEF